MVPVFFFFSRVPVVLASHVTHEVADVVLGRRIFFLLFSVDGRYVLFGGRVAVL